MFFPGLNDAEKHATSARRLIYSLYNLLIAYEIPSPEFIDAFEPRARHCRIQTCFSCLCVDRP